MKNWDQTGSRTFDVHLMCHVHLWETLSMWLGIPQTPTQVRRIHKTCTSRQHELSIVKRVPLFDHCQESSHIAVMHFKLYGHQIVDVLMKLNDTKSSAGVVQLNWFIKFLICSNWFVWVLESRILSFYTFFLSSSLPIIQTRHLVLWLSVAVRWEEWGYRNSLFRCSLSLFGDYVTIDYGKRWVKQHIFVQFFYSAGKFQHQLTILSNGVGNWGQVNCNVPNYWLQHRAVRLLSLFLSFKHLQVLCRDVQDYLMCCFLWGREWN